MPITVNVIYANNGQGLTRDAHILGRALTALDCAVTYTGMSPRRPPAQLRFTPELVEHSVREARDLVRRWIGRVSHSSPWQVNIFLERIELTYIPLAAHNWFVPNPEWLDNESMSIVPAMDRVLFKTSHAASCVPASADQGCFVGFTSDDRYRSGVRRNWRRALHVAGWNRNKGTARLLETWATSPGLPPLVVIAQGQTDPEKANVTITNTRLADGKLLAIQNASGLHVAPSEVEGFGHSLNEALSCGCVLITTDAPPMNTLAPRDAVRLVATEAFDRQRFGTKYFFSQSSLLDVFEDLSNLSTRELEDLGQRARAAYERGRLDFEERLRALIHNV
jgi:glycosyltransferase involved in cell wall biosynthesis